MKIRRKLREKKSHGWKWSFIVVPFAICFIVASGVRGAWGVVNTWLEDLPSVENSDAFNVAQKTRIYANDGTTLLAEMYLENREPVTIDQVSPYVLKGTVATEDERFYEHNGVDMQGIARAVYVNVTGSDMEGASTITQQFVRNTILADEATEISLKRKVREAQLAIDLEKIYSKDEILMMYLNTINYGNGCWGIEAASLGYFQKHANELTYLEAATLIGIPQSPTYLDPTQNPEACLDRRNVVLSRMLKAGVITQGEYDSGILEPLNLNLAPEAAEEGIYAYPYFTSYVKKLLQEQFSADEVFKGGMTVITTIDPNLQNKAQEAANQQYASMDESLDVSLTCIDQNTGYIKAMIGGKDYNSSKYNLATEAQRHAGSSFKTFALAAAIEQGINPATMIDCTSPYRTSSGWTPENFGNINYGIRSIQSATAVSSNTGYVRLSEKITIPAIDEMAQRLGISSPLTGYQSTVLGTDGVNTLEMASAYATIAAGGVKREPVAITQVYNKDGSLKWEHTDAPEQVLSPEVAGATTEVLTHVFTDSDGTARNALLPSGQVAAGKTGTSEEFKNYWLCGYTPQLTCATWIGNAAVESPMSEDLNCTDLWRNFMSMALEGTELQSFPEVAKPDYNNKFNQDQKALEPKEEEEEKDAPSVVGMTLEQAAAALAGFEAQYVEEFSDTVPAGTVISQSQSGNKVTLVVSKGPDPSPKPDPEPDPTPTPDPQPDPKPDDTTGGGGT